MKLHRWADIKNRKMTPKRIAQSDARVARVALAIRLGEVRKAAGLTQQQLGKRASFSQSQLSKLERSGNVEIATLVRYVSAAGGNLQISAVLDGRRLMLLSAKAKDALYLRMHGPRVPTPLDGQRHT